MKHVNLTADWCDQEKIGPLLPVLEVHFWVTGVERGLLPQGLRQTSG